MTPTSTFPAALCALLLGCSTTATVTKSEPATGPSPGTSGQVTPQAGPQLIPKIVVEGAPGADLRFNAIALPALSGDGKQILIANTGEDGARGNPNLELVVLDVGRDVASQKLRVLGVDEELDATQLQARVSEANRFISQGTWVPLPATDIPPPADRTHFVGSVGSLRIRFTEPHLRVDGDNGRMLVNGDYPAWSVKPYHASGVACTNPALLDRVYLDKSQRVLLLHIRYYGTDTCWEPNSTYHVVRLPA